MGKVLVAGATGYLGKCVVHELIKNNVDIRLLIRKESQKELFPEVKDFFIGQITEETSISGICEGIDSVFTSVGITRQKDGLTYMDVDYGGNLNLLNEAIKSKVKTFTYISAINGEKMKNLKIFQAKEKFIDELKLSNLDYKIIRPNGFFSDMGDFLTMATKGKVYLFGHGDFSLNPISGSDLAKVCVQTMNSENKEILVGGPELLSQNQIARLALNALGIKGKVVHIPDFFRKLTIFLLRVFTSSRFYGPIEFFLTAISMDNIAPLSGKDKLESHFRHLVKKTD